MAELFKANQIFQDDFLDRDVAEFLTTEYSIKIPEGCICDDKEEHLILESNDDLDTNSDCSDISSDDYSENGHLLENNDTQIFSGLKRKNEQISFPGDFKSDRNDFSSKEEQILLPKNAKKIKISADDNFCNLFNIIVDKIINKIIKEESKTVQIKEENFQFIENSPKNIEDKNEPILVNKNLTEDQIDDICSENDIISTILQEKSSESLKMDSKLIQNKNSQLSDIWDHLDSEDFQENELVIDEKDKNYYLKKLLEDVDDIEDIELNKKRYKIWFGDRCDETSNDNAEFENIFDY
ncbi:hypothetical protein MHBO_002840 [Bonamia ostreae]|uniref:Uncharacterized protein n=1 Tax=Bonamia ostreae TaxID=126728 RepID=A0ABV2ANQ9_9EUKA